MKHKRGKQVLPIEKKLKKIIRGVLIPHAGRIHAGHARYAALRYFKKTTKQIIYLATLHNIDSSNKTYILHRDKGFRLGKHSFVETKKREQSFDWVHDELIDLFPSANILALGPNAGVKNLHIWIMDYLKKHKDAIFIATVDLIHYGKNNAHYLSYPQQADKIKKEEGLIEALTNPTINLQQIKNIMEKDRNLVDGPTTLNIFMEVMKGMHYTGRVTDYYDSHQKKDLISRYTIDVHPVNKFASYVSIIYGKKMIDDLLPIDILLALGYLKSVITRDIHDKQYILTLPQWSPLFRKTNGVFVGTSLNGKTNCSFGRYEQEAYKTSTASKIMKASQSCTRSRRRISYTTQNIDHLSYKVEFLDPLPWKTYPGHLAPKKFKKDGNHGIYLELPNGKGATYFPQALNPAWSISKMMDMLTKKAGGQRNEWKKGRFEIYQTTSYTWNPSTRMINIYPPPPLQYRGKSKKNSIRKKYHKKTRKKTRKKRHK